MKLMMYRFMLSCQPCSGSWN